MLGCSRPISLCWYLAVHPHPIHGQTSLAVGFLTYLPFLGWLVLTRWSIAMSGSDPPEFQYIFMTCCYLLIAEVRAQLKLKGNEVHNNYLIKSDFMIWWLIIWPDMANYTFYIFLQSMKANHMADYDQWWQMIWVMMDRFLLTKCLTIHQATNSNHTHTHFSVSCHDFLLKWRWCNLLPINAVPDQPSKKKQRTLLVDMDRLLLNHVCIMNLLFVLNYYYWQSFSFVLVGSITS